MTDVQDIYWMERACALALESAQFGGGPFGCVITIPGSWSEENRRPLAVARGTGVPSAPTAHSEMAAIAQAATLINGTLEGCTLYSTHEPCAMCCGAICHSKVSRVVWGSRRASFPDLFRPRRYGASELLQDTTRPPTAVPGVLEDRCIQLILADLQQLNDPERYTPAWLIGS